MSQTAPMQAPARAWGPSWDGAPAWVAIRTVQPRVAQGCPDSLGTNQVARAPAEAFLSLFLSPLLIPPSLPLPPFLSSYFFLFFFLFKFAPLYFIFSFIFSFFLSLLQTL